MSTETLMQVVQWVILATDEWESPEESQAYASFGSLSQPSFR